MAIFSDSERIAFLLNGWFPYARAGNARQCARMWSRRICAYKFAAMGGLYDQFLAFMGGVGPED